MLNAHFNKSVVDHNRIAGLDILGQPSIIDAADLVIAGDIARCERIHIACLDFNGTLGEGAQTDLRSLGVEHGSNRKPQLLTQPLDLFKALFILLIIGMRKIEARNIHACLHHLAKHLVLIRCRTDCAYDFCFSELLKH